MSESHRNKIFWDRLNYSRSKQSDHLNAMIGVGIGFIFGIFSIPVERWIVIIPFLIMIFFVFLHFYGRYYYWLLEESAIEAILNVEDTANFNTVIKDPQNIKNFQEQTKNPEFVKWVTTSINKGKNRFPLFLYRRGPKLNVYSATIHTSMSNV